MLRLQEEQRLKKLIEPRKQIVDGFVGPIKFAARMNACEGFELYSKLNGTLKSLAADCPGLRFNNDLIHRVYEDCGAQIAALIKASYLKLMEEKKEDSKKILDQADSAARVYAEFVATLKDDTQQVVNEELKIANLKRTVNQKKQAERKQQREEQLAKKESDRLKREEEKARKEAEKQERQKRKAEQEEVRKQKAEETKKAKEQREREKQEKQGLLEEKAKKQEEAKRVRQEEAMRKKLSEKLSQMETRKQQEKEISGKKPLTKEEKQAKTKAKKLAELNPQADPKLITSIVAEHQELPLEELQAKLAAGLS